MNSYFKPAEIAFRRILIKLLRIVVRTRRSWPREVDFDKCKFLFVRQDRIGDVLVSTPLLAVLKNKYPNALIDVLLSSNNHFVLANDPLVHKRWIYDKRIVSSWRLLQAIRDEHYDFVIDLMDNPSATSTVICLLSGARWTVGLEKDNAFAYDIVVPLLSRKDVHIVDRIARLLEPFGIDPAREDLRIRYVVSTDSKKFAKQTLKEHGIVSARKIAINISAGHDVRFWGVDNFRALITLVQKRFRHHAILLLSKPSHRQEAEQIASGFTQVYLSPTTQSFDQFAALIAEVNLLITPDTSAVHLAAAFGIPCVAMYVQSDKNLKVWDPYKSSSEILVADVDNLRVISPNEVFVAAQRLLMRRTRARRHSARLATSHS